MDGMIFAAGLGTRLQPLTDNKPKALVELNGVPLLEHVILKMKKIGIKRIVVNVHHHADQIEKFLRSKKKFRLDIKISDERDCLLDTGGGLLKARDFFNPGVPVLVHNVDIATDFDLDMLHRFYRAAGHSAILLTRPADTDRVLKYNSSRLLSGWENKITGEQKIVSDDFNSSKDYTFCGVQIVSPEFLQNMTHTGVFSIIDEYITQAKTSRIGMYEYVEGRVMDLGTPETIAEAAIWIASPEYLEKINKF